MELQQAFFIWHTRHETHKNTYYTCSWCSVGAGAGAIANGRPLRCPDCRTKATCVAASAAASCPNNINSKKLTEYT